VLAGLGADVVKVERPAGGDHTRGNPPYASPAGFSFTKESPDAVSVAFTKRNRNKRSITINLQTDAGRDILLALARESTVLVSNYAPATMARLGLDNETLWAANPQLIHCAISGFGVDVDDDLPAMDTILQGMSGLMASTGFEDGPPVRSGVPLGDMVGAVYAVVGILAALRRVEQTGEGELVDVALLDALASFVVEEPFEVYHAMGKPSRFGNVLPRLAPFGAYETLNGWCTICAPFDPKFVALAEAMGNPALSADPRFSTRDARVINRVELDAIITEWSATLRSEDIVDLLRTHDVPVGPVRTVEEVFDEPGLRRRRAVVDIDLPFEGTRVIGPGIPILMSGGDPVLDVPAPELGQHTDEVLQSLAGVDAAQLAAWRADGVI
jgi:crotonobetainyl-CoA:carnitine CoA-transferase CaiB-like acyl-CoA transferase